MQRDRGQDLLNRLPKIPDEVGRETDILLGIRYRKYLPKLIFELSLVWEFSSQFSRVHVGDEES